MTYEHMAPRFAEAREHKPEDITLLCAGHQLQSSKGLLSLDTIRECDRDPAAKQQGFSNHVFDLGGRSPEIILGSVALQGSRRCGIIVSNEWRLLIEPPEKRSRLWRLSALFQDDQGHIVCGIDKNELILLSDNYDVVQEGRKFMIKGPASERDAEMEIKPPNTLNIQSMNIIDGAKFVRIRPDGVHLHGQRAIRNLRLEDHTIMIDRQGEVHLGAAPGAYG